MKNILILLALFLLCFRPGSYSQGIPRNNTNWLDTTSSTTQEEYNYITKGYKVQIESGLDMKRGYSFVDLGDWGLNYGQEKRNCTFKALMRTGESKPCAIMMIYQRTDVTNGVVYYVCIPRLDASDEIWQQTLNFINTTFADNDKMLQTVIWALMKFSAQEAGR